MVENLHLCLGGPGLEIASFRNKKQGKSCLEMPFPRPPQCLGAFSTGYAEIHNIFTFERKLKQYKSSPMHATNQPKRDYTGRVVEYFQKSCPTNHPKLPSVLLCNTGR
jgi:hypothetical protein